MTRAGGSERLGLPRGWVWCATAESAATGSNLGEGEQATRASTRTRVSIKENADFRMGLRQLSERRWARKGNLSTRYCLSMVISPPIWHFSL